VDAFTLGVGLGFLVALQLGPLSLYLIRSTLRRGWAVGLAIAAGIAVIDLLLSAVTNERFGPATSPSRSSKRIRKAAHHAALGAAGVGRC
jgi:hypothetical protein